MDRGVFKFSRFVSSLLVTSMVASGVGMTPAYAEMSVLPAPSSLVDLSVEKSAPMLKGLKFDPQNPLDIQFVIDTAGNKKVSKEEASQLIRYFLTSLTVPEADMWVNLSPYESERIIDNELAETELGQELLAQDYILKQLGSSLTHPDKETGEQYWKQVHEKGAKNDTFNKIWIMPDAIEIYEGNNNAYITQSTLKVMTEADFLAQQQNATVDAGSSSAIKETILPQISKDVNTGENFASLRQMYNAIILGTWFKKKFQESFYSFYFDTEKLQGIDKADEGSKEKIYNMYVEAFKTGAYNFIKKEYDANTNTKVKRNYFSGGESFVEVGETITITDNESKVPDNGVVRVSTKAAFETVDDKGVPGLERYLEHLDDTIASAVRLDEVFYAEMDDNQQYYFNQLVGFVAEEDIVEPIKEVVSIFRKIKRLNYISDKEFEMMDKVAFITEYSKIFAGDIEPAMLAKIEAVKDYKDKAKGIKDIKSNEILAKAKKTLSENYTKEDLINKQAQLWVEEFNAKIEASGVDIAPLDMEKDLDIVLRTAVHDIYSADKFLEQYTNAKLMAAMVAAHHDKLGLRFFIEEYGAEVNEEQIQRAEYLLSLLRMVHALHKGKADYNAEWSETFNSYVAPVQANEEQFGQDALATIEKLVSSAVRLDDVFYAEMNNAQRYGFDNFAHGIPDETNKSVKEVISIIRDIRMKGDISAKEFVMMEKLAFATELSKTYDDDISSYELSLLEEVKDYKDKEKGIKDIKSNEILAQAKEALPYNYSKDDLVNMQAKLWVKQYNAKLGAFNASSGYVRDNLPSLDLEKDSQIILRTAVHDIYSADMLIKRFPSAKLMAAMVASHHDKLGLRFFIKEYGAELSEEQIQRAEYLLSLLRMVHALHKGKADYNAEWSDTFNSYVAPVQANEEQFGQDALATIEKLVSSAVNEKFGDEDIGQLRDENEHESYVENLVYHRGRYAQETGELRLGDDGSAAFNKRYIPGDLFAGSSADKAWREGGIALKGIGDSITTAAGSSALRLPLELVKAVSGVSFRVVSLNYHDSARKLYAKKWK